MEEDIEQQLKVIEAEAEPVPKDGLWNEEKQRYQVGSEQAFEGLMDVLIRNKTTLDQLEAKEKELTAPLNKVAKEIRARFAPVIGPIKERVSAAREALSQFKTDQHHRLITEAAQNKDKPAVVKEALLEIGKTSYSRDEGSVSFRELPAFEVVDWRKVPIDCLKLNETRVRELLRDRDTIPGLSISMKKSVVVKT